jgi:mannose-6-phosphate isomerase-like protein (cupin superfamily)
MEATHGLWGERVRTFSWDGGLVTILFLEPNKRCSWHKHVATWNQFTCISGEVRIKTEKGYTTTLSPKQVFTVEPGVKHEFQTGDVSAIVEEVAFVKYDETDIQRENVGGDVKYDTHCSSKEEWGKSTREMRIAQLNAEIDALLDEDTKKLVDK